MYPSSWDCAECAPPINTQILLDEVPCRSLLQFPLRSATLRRSMRDPSRVIPYRSMAPKIHALAIVCGTEPKRFVVLGNYCHVTSWTFSQTKVCKTAELA